MREAVDRVIAEREGLDHGLGGSLMVSVFGHLIIAAGALAVGYLAPRKPPIDIMDGFAVALPRGGGGVPTKEAPAPPAQAEAAPPVTAPAAPKVEEPPKILKPPKEEPSKNRLPEPDAKKVKTPEKSPPPRSAGDRGGVTRAAGGVPGGTGRASVTPGLEFGPAGPGIPGGSDQSGDWYLASVQQKIWMIWTQQIKTGFNQSIGVSFTILADGSVEDVQVVQPSGVMLLDLAAQRAVLSAAPFGPLPKHYATNRFTIQARFKPTP